MNLSEALLARLTGRGLEYEQAILRVIVFGVVTIYMWWSISLPQPPVTEQDKIQLMSFAGFFVVAVGIFIPICIWPASNVPLRVLGIVADAGIITFALFFAGEAGAVLVGLYMFITIGNGFRYEAKYWRLCQVLCLAGFLLVMVMAPWWREHPLSAIGWLVSMIVLPLYVFALVQRILAARVKAKQTLKEYRE